MHNNRDTEEGPSALRAVAKLLRKCYFESSVGNSLYCHYRCVGQNALQLHSLQLQRGHLWRWQVEEGCHWYMICCISIVNIMAWGGFLSTIYRLWIVTKRSFKWNLSNPLSSTHFLVLKFDFQFSSYFCWGYGFKQPWNIQPQVSHKLRIRFGSLISSL